MHKSSSSAVLSYWFVSCNCCSKVFQWFKASSFYFLSCEISLSFCEISPFWVTSRTPSLLSKAFFSRFCSFRRSLTSWCYFFSFSSWSFNSLSSSLSFAYSLNCQSKLLLFSANLFSYCDFMVAFYFLSSLTALYNLLRSSKVFFIWASFSTIVCLILSLD